MAKRNRLNDEYFIICNTLRAAEYEANAASLANYRIVHIKQPINHDVLRYSYGVTSEALPNVDGEGFYFLLTDGIGALTLYTRGRRVYQRAAYGKYQKYKYPKLKKDEKSSPREKYLLDVKPRQIKV